MRTISLRHSTCLVISLALSQTVFARNVNRKLITEIDPVSPLTAAYERIDEQVESSKWGINVDFNIAGFISTGPEYWTGDFQLRGPSDPTTAVRREDLWFGERHKLSATRLQWHITKWEIPESMRGWFLSLAYANLKVESKANRHTETFNTADVVSASGEADPAEDTDIITENRHGVELIFGQRWMFVEQRMTVTLGAVLNKTFKRTLSVISKDNQALADYEDLIEQFPFTPLSNQPYPRALLTLGYAW